MISTEDNELKDANSFRSGDQRKAAERHDWRTTATKNADESGTTGDETARRAAQLTPPPASAVRRLETRLPLTVDGLIFGFPARRTGSYIHRAPPSPRLDQIEITETTNDDDGETANGRTDGRSSGFVAEILMRYDLAVMRRWIDLGENV